MTLQNVVRLSDGTFGGVAAVADRFWPKVIKSEDCWTWSGAHHGSGYPQFWDGKRVVRAHRFAWALVNGPIPIGLHVLHRCDNPGCLRPDHLFLGTATDNMRDASRKRRCAFQRHPKLSEQTVREIRSLGAAGEPIRSIASRLGLSHKRTDDVLKGRTWRHVA